MYRVVCTGKNSDTFSAEDGFTAEQIHCSAQAGSYGEYDDIRTEVLCPTHGWSESHVGRCYDCEQEWLDAHEPPTLVAW